MLVVGLVAAYWMKRAGMRGQVVRATAFVLVDAKGRDRGVFEVDLTGIRLVFAPLILH